MISNEVVDITMLKIIISLIGCLLLSSLVAQAQTDIYRIGLAISGHKQVCAGSKPVFTLTLTNNDNRNILVDPDSLMRSLIETGPDVPRSIFGIEFENRRTRISNYDLVIVDSDSRRLTKLKPGRNIKKKIALNLDSDSFYSRLGEYSIRSSYVGGLGDGNGEVKGSLRPIESDEYTFLVVDCPK